MFPLQVSGPPMRKATLGYPQMMLWEVSGDSSRGSRSWRIFRERTILDFDTFGSTSWYEASYLDLDDLREGIREPRSRQSLLSLRICWQIISGCGLSSMQKEKGWLTLELISRLWRDSFRVLSWVFHLYLEDTQMAEASTTNRSRRNYSGDTK